MKRSLILATSALCMSLPTLASATTYYISSHGSDNNNGTSPSTPLATLHVVNSLVYSPGDTILLERGSVWQGILVPCAAAQCSGTAAAPIKIDAYGDLTAPLPRIDGAGSARATVSLVNQSYWEIRNLEVTNHGPGGFHYGGIEAICDSTSAAKRICHHIYIGHNYVHDINGVASYADNGIWVTWNVHNSFFNGQRWVSNSNYWDDIVIEWNTLRDVSHHGIFASDNNPILTSIVDRICPTTGFDCMTQKPNTTGLRIRNNTLINIGGDGIQFGNTDGAVAEYNVLGDWGLNGAGPPAAGIWSYAAHNTVIQHNEVYGAHGGGDREAFDIDFANISTYIQFNYSHNNYGGMLLFEEPHSSDPAATQNYIDDAIVRFNLSLNDGANTAVVNVWNGHWQAGLNPIDFANNSIYQSATNYASGGPNITDIFGITGTRNDPTCQSSLITGTAWIYNNIFVVQGTAVYPRFDPSTGLGANVFHAPGGTSCTPIPGGQVPNVDAGAITQNPMFVAFPAAPATPNDFRLKSTSPVLGNGIYTPYIGGVDYWGNTVPPNVGPNRGAYNGPGL